MISPIQRPPSVAKPKKKNPDEGNPWKDRADELREMLLFIDQEKLEDAGRLLKSVGSGLKGAWQQIKEIPAKIFDLDIVSEKVDEEKREQLLRWTQAIGVAAGFTAAGGHALGGALKLASGHQQKDTSRKLDGIMDMATASTLAATVAGMGTARAILAPLAATFNIFRGGYNSGHGFKTNDGRKQLQGALDAVRSAGSAARLLSSHGAFFKVAGVALAPVAGAIQAGRGLHDVSIGLRNDDNKKQLKGLVDIATAVGTGLAFASGVAIIPGIALAVAANLVKVAYEVSPKARKKLDPIIDKMEPKLAKVVARAEELSEPVRKAWRRVMSRFVKQKDELGPSQFSKSQLAEISHLLLSDGEYTRQEERRLKTTLERTGQGKDLPTRDQEPQARNREALKRELQTKEKRVAFIEFLLVAAHYDNQEKTEETKYVNDLAEVLEVPPEEVEMIRQEYAVLAADSNGTDRAA
jgi:uncharacterized tellurite resistance protein B-like protein